MSCWLTFEQSTAQSSPLLHLFWSWTVRQLEPITETHSLECLVLPGDCRGQFPVDLQLLFPHHQQCFWLKLVIKMEASHLLLWVDLRSLGVCLFVCLFFVFVFVFCFLGLHPWHMKVPRLGVELELQLLAYTTATAKPDLSLVYNLHHSSRQCQILNPLSEATDQTCNLTAPRWIRFCCTMTGTTRSLKWWSSIGQMIAFLQMATDGRKEFIWHLCKILG